MTFATASASRAQASQADLAAFLLRVAMGVLFVLHAWMKIAVFTPSGTAAYFASIGLPGVLAYLTIAAELLGGLALIAGVATRWVALALVPVMVGAGWFGHASAGFFFSNAGGGWEYPAFWTVALVVQALLGDGAYAVGNRAAR
ncbi:DoxX family protein [Rubellimicrobium aerolatum]|uniref:DoxX family protein n=1 Tax=Rubellimicrobium aerolatum TaxID=490979 RepID=A0ABW0SGP7_9RHOB|nr:DoxX family protein [Rubellimicrobium aerolatum]MBP1807361.1 putative oxidoreductase [Rubellimicrobium aerolatum]